MVKKSFILVSFIVFLIAFSSCEYKWIEGVDSSVPQSFSSDIQPIFDANCVSCHDGTQRFSLKAGESYNSIISKGLIDSDNNSNSLIYTLPSGHPTVNYPTNARESVLVWIQQGANDN